MFSARVSLESLNTKRLDSDFYRPDYVKVEKKLLTLQCVSLGKVGRFFTGPFGSKLPSRLYLDQGIPLFRVGNVGQLEVLTDSFAYLAPEVHEDLKSSEVVPGDLLIVKASVGEKICKVPDWLPKANITQHIIGIKPNGSRDVDYISAFLFSRYGVLQLQRYSLGSIIQYLGVTDAKSVLLYDANILVQKYIGDKVRQAEQLRVWAQSKIQNACTIFEKEIHWDSGILDVGIINRASVAELSGRLDLKFNSPKRLAVMRHINANKICCSQLSQFVDISAMIGWKGLTTEYYRESGPWLLRGVEFNNGVIDFESLVSIDREKYLEQPQIHLRENDIAFSKDGTIGKAIVIPELSNELAAGSTIARLRFKPSVNTNPYYLEFVLNHPFVQVQIESFATGVAQPHITQEWIAQLLIPRVDDESAIGNELQLHHKGQNVSKKLMESAKILVEALIEGLISEDQLARAQQALEDGDTSLDQDILSKLTEAGFAVENSKPLFSDLDELYRLLEAAKMDTVDK